MVFFRPLQLTPCKFSFSDIDIFHGGLGIFQLWVDAEIIDEQLFEFGGFGGNVLTEGAFARPVLCVLCFDWFFFIEAEELSLDGAGLLDFLEVSVYIESDGLDGGKRDVVGLRAAGPFCIFIAFDSGLLLLRFGLEVEVGSDFVNDMPHFEKLHFELSYDSSVFLSFLLTLFQLFTSIIEIFP